MRRGGSCVHLHRDQTQLMNAHQILQTSWLSRNGQVRLIHVPFCTNVNFMYIHVHVRTKYCPLWSL